MEKKISLPSADWFEDEAIQRLFMLFPERSLRIVGGAVRDAFLKKPVSDIDFATTLPPEEVIELLEMHEMVVKPTGIDFGTVTVVIDGVGYEVTTLREDSDTDGRHCKVSYTDDWEVDAARRDFTINAMSLDRDGNVHDFFGGIEDAEAGRILFVGDAEARIQEDYLRILRFYRFYAHYGKEPANKAILEACYKHRDGIAQLAGERIAKEMVRLLEADDPLPTLHMMRENDLFATIALNPQPLEGVEAQAALLSKLVDANVRAKLWLVALVAHTGSDPAVLAGRWKMSNPSRDLLTISMRATVLPWKEACYRYGKSIALAQAVVEARDELIDIMNYQVPVFQLRGKDLLENGVHPGPEVGQRLKKAEDFWVEHDYHVDQEKLLEVALG